MGFIDSLLGRVSAADKKKLQDSEDYLTRVTGQTLQRQVQQGKITPQQFSQQYGQRLQDSTPQLSQWEKRNVALADAASRNRIINPVLGGLAQWSPTNTIGNASVLAGSTAKRFGVQSPLVDRLINGGGQLRDWTAPKDEFAANGSLLDSAIRTGVAMPKQIAEYVANPLYSMANTYADVSTNQYRNAIAAGVDPNKAYDTAALLGAGSAALEKIGLGKVLGGTGRTAVRRIGGSLLTEGVTEGAQQALENKIAQQTYDPTRGLFQGVPQAAGMGAVFGGAITGGAEGFNAVTNPVTRTKAQSTVTSTVNPNIKQDPEWRQHDTNFNKSIERANQPNTPPRLRNNYLKEAKESMRLRNERAKMLIGEGGYIRLRDNKEITPKKFMGGADYTMSHRPAEGPRAFDLTEQRPEMDSWAPKDMYEQWYGSRGSLADKESINALKAIKGNPEADVTIYRASPNEDLNHGDWVTLSKDYARQHAEGQGGKVHAYTVKAKDLKWAMDDVNEFGFYPEKTKNIRGETGGGFLGNEPTIKNMLGEDVPNPNYKPQVSNTPLPNFIKNEQEMQDYMSKITNLDSSSSPDAPNASSVPDASLSVSSTQPTQTQNLQVQQSQDTQKLAVNDKVSPLPKSTPKQLEIKDSTAQFSNEQSSIAKQYADLLMSTEDGARGGDMIPDGEGGYKRITSHSKFYSDYYKEFKRKPSKQAWADEAKRQLQAGQGAPDLQKSFDELSDPEFRALVQSQEASTGKGSIGDTVAGSLVDSTAKVKQQSRENNIPVRKVTQEGDYVTATNVNPNIKAKEKRYSLDNNGDLIEDKKGAYSLFTDDEGKVKGFRVGTEYIDAKDLGDLSDVNKYSSTMATMRRNVERSFGKETGDKVNRFLVDHQQGQATKMINRQIELNKGTQAVADDLGISFAIGSKKAKQVSADIQNFGEGLMTRSELDTKYGKEYAQKIANADKWFRGQYDTLLTEANKTLTAHGYDPIPKRKNYYTHFSEPKLWESFGLKMQEIKNLASPTLQDSSPEQARGSISNSMAGQSEFTQPNKRFNPFALQRKGTQHTADAFKSFETYLSPTLNNIYMTPSITRARVLSRAIAQDADLAGKDANGVLIQMKEWANNLAGKSSRMGDRQLSDMNWGRKYMAAANWAQKKAGQNTIIGNLATAVMQPIVLTQTAGKFGYKNTLLATMQEMHTAHGDNAPIRQSEFMQRRYGKVDSVTATKGDRARGLANKPLEIVEETAARITWNAAHNDAVSRGLEGKEAIRYADIEAEKTMSGRAIGEKPELFRSKALGPATMYQLEVSNYWQQMKEMTPTQKAKTFVAMYAFGALLKGITGSEAGFNPIDAVIDAFGEIEKEDKSAKDKAISAGQRLLGEVVDNTPVVPQVATMLAGEKNVKKILGPDSNVGRFGVSSPISTLVTNPISLVAGGGASQAKKTYQGFNAVNQGGIKDKDGNTQVDIPKTPANYIRGTLFGKNAIPEVNQYNDNLGKKKVDQKPVQNQIVSTAGTQSNKGLTKEQQETLASMTPAQKTAYEANVKRGMVNPNGSLKDKFIAENKVSAKAEKEFEQIKKSTGSGQLSDGQYVATINGEPKKFKTKAKADQAVFEDEFANGDKKTAQFGNKVYFKDDTTERGFRTQSKSDYDFDKSMSGVAIELDKAKAANNLDAYKQIAEKKYTALTKKLEGLDPETDFKEIDSVNKQILDLQQEYEKYDSQGYIRKGKSGKGKNSFSIPSGFSLLPSGSSRGSVSSLLKNAKVTYKG